MPRRLALWAVNLRIATKIAVSFGLLIAIFLCQVAVTFPNLARIQLSDSRALGSFKVLDATKTVWINILKQENDVRGFLLSHDASFLERATADDDAVKTSLVALRRLIAASASQRIRADRLAKVIETWRSQVFANATTAGAQTSTIAASLGAEGALSRILRTLGDIDAEDTRDLADRDLARAQAFAAAYWTNALAPVVALTVAAWLGWALHRRFAQPIGQLTDAMRRLAGGDTAIAIPFTGWKEEIGAMSRALAVFQKAVHDAASLREEQHVMQDRAATDRARLVQSMADRFEAVVGKIVADVTASATQTQASAEALLSLAELTTADVRAVTGITKRASSTMQDIAHGARSLGDAVGDINSRMAYSTDVAHKAVAEADRTTASIRRLKQSAEEVEAVVSLINGIARHTNLLALNATIEAARAGESGRGFSVVASEVKALADQTARATVQIRQQIQGISAAAVGAAGSIAQISQTIAEMAHITRDMTGILEAQGAATRDMMEGTQASARLTSDVSSQLDVVSEAAVTTGRAATGLLSSAKVLTQQSTVLQGEARSFVASVRAG